MSSKVMEVTIPGHLHGILVTAYKDGSLKDFLDSWEQREAMRIAAATTEEERTKVHFRVLLIAELRNSIKSLSPIDT